MTTGRINQVAAFRRRPARQGRGCAETHPHSHRTHLQTRTAPQMGTTGLNWQVVCESKRFLEWVGAPMVVKTTLGTHIPSQERNRFFPRVLVDNRLSHAPTMRRLTTPESHQNPESTQRHWGSTGGGLPPTRAVPPASHGRRDCVPVDVHPQETRASGAVTGSGKLLGCFKVYASRSLASSSSRLPRLGVVLEQPGGRVGLAGNHFWLPATTDAGRIEGLRAGLCSEGRSRPRPIGPDCLLTRPTKRDGRQRGGTCSARALSGRGHTRMQAPPAYSAGRRRSLANRVVAWRCQKLGTQVLRRLVASAVKQLQAPDSAPACSAFCALLPTL